MTTNRNNSPGLVAEIAGMRYNKGLLEPRTIPLAREVPYTLFVNDREILSMATLPTHLRELFVGFLVSEGVLTTPDEITECVVDHGNRIARVELNVPEERIEKLERKGMLTSGCAGGLVFSVEVSASPREKTLPSLVIPAASILKRMLELDTYRGIYSITRGVHAASVATVSDTLVILEDLGRHNAVDKIVGYCFLNRVQTADKLLLTTGRITSEVLTKAARSRFPIVVSRSSASAMAVGMAKQAGIDVATYARGGRFDYFPHGSTEVIEGLPAGETAFESQEGQDKR
ncbi:MAG TPA: formate dehydrogenase accessory sulfurtransferase FdhD [Desulfomonilaceae bacterium]|nr:formate dehydrogenase accessory sulfurtransferase FdhD [Desulfomonilaceae bacterium]